MTKWEEMYQRKLTTVPELMKTIPNGAKIVSGIGNAQPRALFAGLAELIKQGNHRDVYVYSTLAMNSVKIADPSVSSLCHYAEGFLTPFTRPLFAKGITDYRPIMFSDGKTTLQYIYDTIFQTVSPMDKHGYFSMGMEPDYIWDLIKYGGKRVVFEVNENFPPTYGDNYIHISEVDAIVEDNWELFVAPTAETSATDEKIAEHIAELVPDGACLQLGIGGLPNAIGQLLTHKKDLGFHSEMVCDAFLELYKAGALNNSKKNFMPGKGIGTFAYGSKELYDWLEMNPGVEMWPASIVNDPRVASKNDNLITVNGIVEADILGQCVADEMNGKTYSGLGGQQDFVLAGYWSKGGKSFLALPSSRIDKEGKKHSNILFKCTGTIGTTRWNSHYIVTEYGSVCLKGLSVHERVKEMVRIADPDFRDELMYEAKKQALTD